MDDGAVTTKTRTSAADPPVFRTALIVDQDADTRLLYRLALGTLALKFIEAEDGQHALEQATSHCPDLIVTDARLPRMDGHCLCSMLRHDWRTRTARILLITAAVHRADIDDALAAGADEVLLKPCNLDDIRDAARRSSRVRAAARGSRIVTEGASWIE